VIARTLSKTVTFSKPFLLKGIGRMLPAGTYRVVTDEELIEGVSFPGLPPRRNDDFRTVAVSPFLIDRNGDDRSRRPPGCTRLGRGSGLNA
jgi:hypothetical protein